MTQGALFAASALPPGFTYAEGFLSADEEAVVLAGIATLELREAQYKEFTAKRRVAGFGTGYDFDANELTPGPRERPYSLDLASRSAYALRGEARWDWQHAIAPTPAQRDSITFRSRRG